MPSSRLINIDLFILVKQLLINLVFSLVQFICLNTLGAFSVLIFFFISEGTCNLFSVSVLISSFSIFIISSNKYIAIKLFCFPLSEQVIIKYVSSDDTLRLVILYNLSKVIFFIFSLVLISQT